MPLVRFPPEEVKKKYIELELENRRRQKEYEANPAASGHYSDGVAAGKASGFLEAISMLYPDTAGYMIMDADCAEEGKELLSDSLPRIIFVE